MRLTTLALGLALALPLAPLWLSGCGRAEAAEALPSVRLGMSPRDVRDRFEPSTQGSWQTKLGSPNDDTVLEWVARDTTTSRITTARFEFHLGMLVAVRAHFREPVSAETVDVTEKTVTARTPASAGGSELVILARDCPTHREEAATVASRSTKPQR